MKNKKWLAAAFMLLLSAMTLTACAGESNAHDGTGASGVNVGTYAPTSDSTTPIATPEPPAIEVSVSDETQLREAVSTAGDTHTAITLTADIELVSDFVIPRGAEITLQSSGNNMFSLISTRDMPTLTVDGGNLTINGIRITSAYGTRGTGVAVSSGTFTMNSGEISGNHGIHVTAGCNPGGVRISGGTFIMNGGRISNNQGGGANNGAGGVDVSNLGTFTMNGGEISENIGLYFVRNWSLAPGGVNVRGSHATFTMNGGSINNNTGVGIGIGLMRSWLGGNVVLYGGTIHENTHVGVNNGRGTLTMYGGTISNNYAGGVWNGDRFTMNDGAISNNGGMGVYNGSSEVGLSRFTMNGGTISGNANTNEQRQTAGGGVFIDNRTTFTINGGWIFDNIADTDADLHLGHNTTFNNNVFDADVGGIGVRPPR